jgi:hypothetical protein
MPKLLGSNVNTRMSAAADPIIEKLVAIAEQTGEGAEIWADLIDRKLGWENLDAFGEGMDQAGRGLEQYPSPGAKGVGMGMVFGGKLLKSGKTKQLDKFLNFLGDITSGRKAGWAAKDKLTPEEEFAKLYSHGRRTPATRETLPFSNQIPDAEPGQFGSFSLDPGAGKLGGSRGRVRLSSPGTSLAPAGTRDPLTERIVGIAHELRHGSYHKDKARKGNPNWFFDERELPYKQQPTEIASRGAENPALADFEEFMDVVNDPTIVEKLSPKGKKVATAFRMAGQASNQRKLAQDFPGMGYTEQEAEDLMERAWKMLDPQSQSVFPHRARNGGIVRHQGWQSHQARLR